MSSDRRDELGDFRQVVYSISDKGVGSQCFSVVRPGSFMVVRRGVYCLNQDLQDFRIFRMVGVKLQGCRAAALESYIGDGCHSEAWAFWFQDQRLMLFSICDF